MTNVNIRIRMQNIDEIKELKVQKKEKLKVLLLKSV